MPSKCSKKIFMKKYIKKHGWYPIMQISLCNISLRNSVAEVINIYIAVMISTFPKDIMCYSTYSYVIYCSTYLMIKQNSHIILHRHYEFLVQKIPDQSVTWVSISSPTFQNKACCRPWLNIVLAHCRYVNHLKVRTHSSLIQLVSYS